ADGIAGLGEHLGDLEPLPLGPDRDLIAGHDHARHVDNIGKACLGRLDDGDRLALGGLLVRGEGGGEEEEGGGCGKRGSTRAEKVKRSEMAHRKSVRLHGYMDIRRGEFGPATSVPRKRLKVRGKRRSRSPVQLKRPSVSTSRLVLQPERRISGGEAEVWFEMNAVEIEEAISALAEQPFDAQEFPFTFLQAFGNKETTLKRLRKGETNKSDLGGVLQTSNIHIAAAAPGEVTRALAALKASPATAKAKARFIVATDGTDFEAEDLGTGETIACAYAYFPDHFGFFLPLAGITTVKQVRESSFDIRATSRMNRLYVELLKDNPDWGTAARRHDMNHFMARLIFCFFAENTDIFHGKGLFTATIVQMSAKDSSNTHEVIGELFRAMNTKREDRQSAGIPRWADAFPYVNGELFSGS